MLKSMVQMLESINSTDDWINSAACEAGNNSVDLENNAAVGVINCADMGINGTWN